MSSPHAVGTPARRHMRIRAVRHSPRSFMRSNAGSRPGYSWRAAYHPNLASSRARRSRPCRRQKQRQGCPRDGYGSACWLPPSSSSSFSSSRHWRTSTRAMNGDRPIRSADVAVSEREAWTTGPRADGMARHFIAPPPPSWRRCRPPRKARRRGAPASHSWWEKAPPSSGRSCSRSQCAWRSQARFRSLRPHPGPSTSYCSSRSSRPWESRSSVGASDRRFGRELCRMFLGTGHPAASFSRTRKRSELSWHGR